MTPPTGAAPRRGGWTAVRHGEPFRRGSRAESTFRVLETECERLGRTITKHEWWSAVASTPAERPIQLKHFPDIMKQLVARRLVVCTVVPGTVTTFRPAGSVVAHAGLADDPVGQALVETVTRLSAERGRAVSTEEVNAAMRASWGSFNGKITSNRLRALADASSRVHAPRVQCVPLFAPGRIKPTLYWLPRESALPTPTVPLSPTSAVRAAVWHTEMALGRPVMLEEVRRWAQVHHTEAACAFRALRQTKTFFEVLAAHSAAQGEALRTPWTCAGGAALHYSIVSLWTGPTHPAGSEAPPSARPVDIDVPEACERLGAVYASALAVALDAHRTWQDLAQFATRRTPAGAGDLRPILLQATAILELFDDSERHMLQRGTTFATKRDVDHPNDVHGGRVATFEGAVARAQNALAMYRQWVEHAKEAGRGVETKRIALRRHEEALTALVPLRALCRRLVAETPPAAQDLVRVQTVGANSGVVVRAALPAAVAARRLLGDTGVAHERRAYHSLDAVRRVPGVPVKMNTGARAFYAAGSMDRVDAVRTTFGQLPMPRAAAMLASAAAWLGPVVRDIRAVREQLDWMPAGQASNRRAVLVSLGLLGDLEVVLHPAVVLDDPLDVAAAALAVVCASLMPPMGINAPAFDQGGREAIRHRGMLEAIRNLETRVRDASTGEGAASLRVIARAVQRIRTERWFEVID